MIPHCFKDDRYLGSATTVKQRNRGNGSRLYKVNIWMWGPRMETIAKEGGSGYEEKDQGVGDEEASEGHS
jgi:hypothetical protein